MLKRSVVSAVMGVVALGLSVAGADEPPAMPEFPKPTAEHQWLAQLEGTWTLKSECSQGPGAEPFCFDGTETVRSLGGFWVQSESKMETGDPPMIGISTLGYDPETKKYVGTWVDSMTSHLWKYEGTVDATGKILTLDSVGPNMIKPGTMGRFQDIIEIQDKDHKVMRSMMEVAPGEWVQIATVKATRSP